MKKGLSQKLFFSRYLPHSLRRWIYARRRPAEFQRLQEIRDGRVEDGRTCEPFDRCKCIFVHIPKTGGVSITNSLFGGKAAGHLSIDEYRLMFDKHDFTQYFKFAFVRNPWSRLLSAYAFLKRGGFHASDRAWAERHLAPFDDFNHFVEGWVKTENILSFPHFAPQHLFICAGGDRTPAVDFLGRFERIDEDFTRLCSYLPGMEEKELLHLNTPPGGKRMDYREIYSSQARRVVEKVYKEDIRVLGYTFDN
jgi:hypothetical protein